MRNHEYGKLSRTMVIDALCGAEVRIGRAVYEKMVEVGFMFPADEESGRPSWNREKLGDLTTDTLVDLYISLKNTEVPRVLS